MLNRRQQHGTATIPLHRPGFAGHASLKFVQIIIAVKNYLHVDCTSKKDANQNAMNNAPAQPNHRRTCA